MVFSHFPRAKLKGALGHGPIRISHGVLQLATVEAPGWEGADGRMHSLKNERDGILHTKIVYIYV